MLKALKETLCAGLKLNNMFHAKPMPRLIGTNCNTSNIMGVIEINSDVMLT